MLWWWCLGSFASHLLEVRGRAGGEGVLGCQWWVWGEGGRSMYIVLTCSCGFSALADQSPEISGSSCETRPRECHATRAWIDGDLSEKHSDS